MSEQIARINSLEHKESKRSAESLVLTNSAMSGAVIRERHKEKTTISGSRKLECVLLGAGESDCHLELTYKEGTGQMAVASSAAAAHTFDNACPFDSVQPKR